MTAKLEQLEGLKRQLSVTVLAEEVSKNYHKKVADFAHQAKLKGFRPGKVPVKVVEQKFGKGLLHEAAAELIDRSFNTQLTEQKIKIAGMPQIDFDFNMLNKNNAINYIAKFEVYPEVTLKDLTDVEIESVSGEINDDDVSAMLVQLRTQHAEWHSVDRTAKLGDRLKIDFDGMVDDKPLEKGNAKNHVLELGSNTMIPGFEEGLIGIKKGETKTLNIAFPADYHVESLREKPAAFTVVVHDVQEPKLPVLDDEFAKKIGVTDGLDALKKQAKEKMQSELNEIARAQTKKIVLDKLLSLNSITVPVALIDAEINHLQNMTRQQIAQYRRLSEADMKKIPLERAAFEEDAKKRVVLGLLLAEVIKAHDIKLDQEKVRERLSVMATQYGDPAQILPIILKNKQMVSDVEAFVLEEQAVQALLTKARVLPVKKSYDAIINAKTSETT